MGALFIAVGNSKVISDNLKSNHLIPPYQPCLSALHIYHQTLWSGLFASYVELIFPGGPSQQRTANIRHSISRANQSCRRIDRR